MNGIKLNSIRLQNKLMGNFMALWFISVCSCIPSGENSPIKRTDKITPKTAMVYLIRCVVLAGVTGTLAGVMQVLSFGAEEMTTLTASLGVAICPLLYAFVIATLLVQRRQ